METNTQEIFDAGISVTKKAVQRLSAVMEAEGKKRIRTANGSHQWWMFRNELQYVI
jgi:hypothetical protein